MLFRQVHSHVTQIDKLFWDTRHRVGCCVLEDRLHLLFDDNGAINMFNIVSQYSEVYFFVVHMVSEPHIVDNIFEYKERNDVETNSEGGGQS